jgi:hypothetical protein
MLIHKILNKIYNLFDILLIIKFTLFKQYLEKV